MDSQVQVGHLAFRPIRSLHGNSLGYYIPILNILFYAVTCMLQVYWTWYTYTLRSASQLAKNTSYNHSGIEISNNL